MRRPLRLPLTMTMALVVVFAAWSMWGRWHAGSLMAKLPAGLDEDHLRVRISLPFEPESFHVLRAQEIGQLVGVEGRDLLMVNVQRSKLARFARSYWVSGLSEWKRGVS